MVAGEFVDVYEKQTNSWDCIVTCFFIDTAHNFMEYCETIHKTLKPGGLWVNIGPLLWHYADQPEEQQIELPWEEIEQLIPKMGFTFRKREWKKCYYTNRLNSMLNIEYNSIFFSCTKDISEDDEEKEEIGEEGEEEDEEIKDQSE